MKEFKHGSHFLCLMFGIGIYIVFKTWQFSFLFYYSNHNLIIGFKGGQLLG